MYQQFSWVFKFREVWFLKDVYENNLPGRILLFSKYKAEFLRVKKSGCESLFYIFSLTKFVFYAQFSQLCFVIFYHGHFLVFITGKKTVSLAKFSHFCRTCTFSTGIFSILFHVHKNLIFNGVIFRKFKISRAIMEGFLVIFHRSNFFVHVQKLEKCRILRGIHFLSCPKNRSCYKVAVDTNACIQHSFLCSIFYGGGIEIVFEKLLVSY